MATFKVGQRVRVVSVSDWASGNGVAIPVGTEGVIVEVGAGCWHYGVEILAYRHEPTEFPPTHWGFDAHQLAPLTPPAADTWAADAVRKVVKPIHTEPVVKVKERA